MKATTITLIAGISALCISCMERYDTTLIVPVENTTPAKKESKEVAKKEAKKVTPKKVTPKKETVTKKVTPKPAPVSEEEYYRNLKAL